MVPNTSYLAIEKTTLQGCDFWEHERSSWAGFQPASHKWQFENLPHMFEKSDYEKRLAQQKSLSGSRDAWCVSGPDRPE